MTQLERRLRAPSNPASRRAKTYWTVRALGGWVAVLAVLTAIALTVAGSWGALVLGVSAAVAAGHLIVMPRWRFRVHRWETTDSAVYTQSGWFTQERRVAPVARIQTIDTHRGPFEQLFGLSNITVTTASAAGPLKIHALDRAVADGLVAALTARARPEDGDGT